MPLRMEYHRVHSLRGILLCKLQYHDTLLCRQRVHDFRLLILTFTLLREPWHGDSGFACNEAVAKAAEAALCDHYIRRLDPLPDPVVRHEIVALDMFDRHRRMPDLGHDLFSAARRPAVYRRQQTFKRIGIRSQHYEYHSNGPPYTAFG